jgi:hypothetical protein
MVSIDENFCFANGEYFDTNKYILAYKEVKGKSMLSTNMLVAYIGIKL